VELILSESPLAATGVPPQHFQFTPFRSTLMSGFFEAMHTVDRKTTAGGEFDISHRLR
jgi:hypothetical protein